jgi:hypothetical protein
MLPMPLPLYPAAYVAMLTRPSPPTLSMLWLLSPVALAAISAVNMDALVSNPDGPVFLALCFATWKLKRLMLSEVIIKPSFSCSNVEIADSNSVNCW